jgi:RNA polymerase sigma factor (TIGR02999 family)
MDAPQTSENAGEITGLLRAWCGGDGVALERLAPLIADELRKVARHYMRGERECHTLQTTALVNEVWVRLVESAGAEWRDRSHFYAAAAQMMRRILVDSARARRAGKRGGPLPKINLDDAAKVGAFHIGTGQDREIVALDDALNTLARRDPRKVRMIELRYFAGLSVEETAEVLQVSTRTVKLDWTLAKAWLSRELRRGAEAEATAGGE